MYNIVTIGSLWNDPQFQTNWWIHCWNQPVLSNEGNVSCSKKQWGHLMGLKFMTDWRWVWHAIHCTMVPSRTILDFWYLHTLLPWPTELHFVNDVFWALVSSTNTALFYTLIDIFRSVPCRRALFYFVNVWTTMWINQPPINKPKNNYAKGLDGLHFVTNFCGALAKLAASNEI